MKVVEEYCCKNAWIFSLASEPSDRKGITIELLIFGKSKQCSYEEAGEALLAIIRPKSIYKKHLIL